MGKGSYFIIGAALGAAVGIAVNYLFGPAPGTPQDERYRSRLDAALEAGERAADQRELEMRTRFEAAKLRRPQQDLPPVPDPDADAEAPA